MDSRMVRPDRRTLGRGDVLYDESGTPLRLGGLLRNGGRGQVWSVAGGRAAVKVLRATRAGDAERLRARLAAVRRYDLDGIPIARPLSMLGEERVGYVMELPGDMIAIESLGRIPQRVKLGEHYRGTGGLGRRLRLLTSTAEALARLHARALAFGDVSPVSILVSRESAHEQVWLIDPDNLTVESAAADRPVYTPGYAAPELIDARCGYSTSSDSFAFAVVAFETLVLAHPFRGDLAYEDVDREADAFAGLLPWVDHSSDDRNRSRFGLHREAALSKGLLRLFRQTFEEGLHDPAARPTLGEWASGLAKAAALTIGCPRCAAGYYG
ncbi:hypothetical protein, partial [Streptomyces sp. SID3343]|uniref:protein kinase domain-containing protein n=1 Tax=Streptomyces sp. SID3343 TaxID=2690260 RepID=UPI00136FC065|nr:hypothetical protein [Streptomyces sp. SID3343]